VSEEAQAAYYGQILEGVEANEWLDKVFFYQLIDEPGTLDQWGILRVDLTLKLAYEAYLRHIMSHTSTAALHRQAIDSGMQQ
jgi:hypothetical protein